MNLTSVRTNHEDLCDFKTYDTFISQSCKSILFVYLNVTNARRALPFEPSYLSTSSAQSLLFLRKGFQSYVFFSKATNLTEKALFLEPISIDCPNCNVDLDPNLMMQLCYSSTCAPPLTNSSVKLNQAVLLTVAFGSPEYLYRYDLRDIAVYDNGVLVTSRVEEFMLGTVSALRVASSDLDQPDGSGHRPA